VRQRASDFIALMTPVVKAMFTDMSFESANLAVQCYGGHGYIRESGVEQYARDARITMIYEGTNGVQALDLVGRKLGAHMGRYLAASSPRFGLHRGKQCRRADEADGRSACQGIWRASALDRDSRAASNEGWKPAPRRQIICGCSVWSRWAIVSPSQKSPGFQLFFGTEDKRFDAKIKTAIFFFERILPQATAHFLSIKAGKKSLMALEDEVFDAPRISWRPPCDPGHRRADVSGLWSGPGGRVLQSRAAGHFSRPQPA
jgi:hypothetical protein